MLFCRITLDNIQLTVRVGEHELYLTAR